MAVGDIVNGINTTDGVGYFTFQPASGVGIIITYASPTYTGGQIQIFNGTQYVSQEISTSRAWNQFNIKMGINNTNYLRIYNTAADVGNSSGYSGIQTE